MPVLKDAMPLMKEPHPLPQAPLPWILPSLFAAFNVVLLVVFSGLFFAFPCRWLAQNGEWAFPLVTGLLCVLTFFSLVSLNFSDPGILHQGSNEQGPMMVHVVWVNQRAFRLQWCQKCCFHRPPRTYHCPWCNICVEAKGGSNSQPLLVTHAGHYLSPVLGGWPLPVQVLTRRGIHTYAGPGPYFLNELAMLAGIILCLPQPASSPASPHCHVGAVLSKGPLRQALVVLVVSSAPSAVPRTLLRPPDISERMSESLHKGIDNALGEKEREKCLMPRSLGKKGREQRQQRAWEGGAGKRRFPLLALTSLQCRYLQGYNPFDHGCASNWYVTICAPLGPKYMTEAVWLQRVAGSDWVPMQNLHFPVCPSVLSPPALPEPGSGPQPQPLSLHKPGKVPSGRGSSPPGGKKRERERERERENLCVLGEGFCGYYKCRGEPPHPMFSWP
ncbi:palmitoyltransferase ZDHHC19 [Lynx rufus]|uniref:palmitoyltransferase ZDHHC19 n=1 Tax=Lynx rufus TaxID=61384 RepID=UPI001F1256BE|nr:palmitoyltransferase ZDHHC19 [Lynx rufus]